MLREASKSRIKLVTLLAFISMPLSGFVTDIYLPSFPSMAKGLMVSERDIQLTLTSYLLSYGISQLFIGSILDNIGRYLPRLFSLFILLLSSIAIASTDSVFIICFLRSIQGIAVATLVVATRALFADLYQGDKLKNYLSYFTIVWSCGPILAPFLGGYLEKIFNWQANFYFLAFYAAILLVFELIYSSESIAEKKKINLSQTVSVYKSMLQNKQFMLGILILGISYSIVMLFNITGPFIIENTFHYTSVAIGYCTLLLGFSWGVGGFIAKKRMNQPFNKRIGIPIAVQLVAIIGLLGVSMFYESIFVMVGFAFLIHIISGVLFTTFFTSSMLFFPTNAGTAGGLMGGLVYIITSISGSLISLGTQVSTQGDLAWRYLFFAILLLLVVFSMSRLQKKA